MIIVACRARADHSTLGTMTRHTGSFVRQIDVGCLDALEDLAVTGIAIHRDMGRMTELCMDIPTIRRHRLGDHRFIRRRRLDLVTVGTTRK